MMNCREVTASASDYLEHRLKLPTRLGVALHLLLCRGCRVYVQQLRLAMEGLRALARPPEMAGSVDPRLLEEFRKATRRDGE